MKSSLLTLAALLISQTAFATPRDITDEVNPEIIEALDTFTGHLRGYYDDKEGGFTSNCAGGLVAGGLLVTNDHCTVDINSYVFATNNGDEYRFNFEARLATDENRLSLVEMNHQYTPKKALDDVAHFVTHHHVRSPALDLSSVVGENEILIYAQVISFVEGRFNVEYKLTVCTQQEASNSNSYICPNYVDKGASGSLVLNPENMEPWAILASVSKYGVGPGHHQVIVASLGPN